MRSNERRRTGRQAVAKDQTISLADLRAITAKLLDHLAEVRGEAVSIPHDYFWSIPGDQLYDVYSDPHDLEVGQLFESWDFLRANLTGETDPLAYGLVWLADILRAIGLEVVG
jgi:hypothetical protein